MTVMTAPRRAWSGLPRSALLVGLGLSAWAAVVGLLLILGPALVGWAWRPGHAGWSGPLRVGALVWLSGLHVGLATRTGPLTVAPLGVSLLTGALLWRAGRVLAGQAAGRGRTGALHAAVGLVVGFATLAGLLARLAQGGPASASPVRAAFMAGLVALVLGGGGALRDGWTELGLPEPPGWLIRAGQGAAAGAGALLAAGALTLAAVLSAHAGAVSALAERLHPGVAGGWLLLLADLALLPNLLVATCAWLVGGPLATGVGGRLTLLAGRPGRLPGLPVFGAVPQHGTALAVLLGVAALASAVAVARRSTAAPQSAWWAAVAQAAGSAALLAAGLALAAGWAGGTAAAFGALGVRPVAALLAGLATLVPAAGLSAAARYWWTGRRAAGRRAVRRRWWWTRAA